MGSPARQKRLGLSFFALTHLRVLYHFFTLLSGFVGLSGFAFLSKMTSSGFVVLRGRLILSKWVANFWQLAIFKNKNGNLFSLELQRKDYQFVICHFIL
nr:MAG TPA: hypothetical protein [Caudoviricetes sp.]